MTVGLGAVATTFMAGVMAARRGLALPVGSFAELGVVPVGSRVHAVRDLVDLAALEDIRFAAWDPFSDDALVAARRARVLPETLLDAVSDELRAILPLPACFDRAWVPALDGSNVLAMTGLRARGEAIREDIRRMRSSCSRVVVAWCGSTEVRHTLASCHDDIAAFEAGLDHDDPAIAPSQVYAWAAIREGAPFANASPNPTVEVPALARLASDTGVPIAGSDLKTGQTLLKATLAGMLSARRLGVAGWYSTNILGNRDGQVLSQPGPLSSKLASKSELLPAILDGAREPGLYGDLCHTVDIRYHPPRGDEKESWDSIDLFGWMGLPMQLKVNFLCRDSVLAAPLVLDLVLFLDLAQRAGQRGLVEWLGFYFKTQPGSQPAHEVHVQLERLRRALVEVAG